MCKNFINYQFFSQLEMFIRHIYVQGCVCEGGERAVITADLQTSSKGVLYGHKLLSLYCYVWSEVSGSEERCTKCSPPNNDHYLHDKREV